jgi:hypothetical protein
MKSLNISRAGIGLAAVLVVGSATTASAQYVYAPYGNYGYYYNVPTEQQPWYDRNAVGQNV